MSNIEKVNILLVDDQPARLLTYETILESLGQNLVRATSGREALEQIMKGDFAVVLMDVSMPDIDGFEAARLIHEHPRFEKTPIIFVTGVHINDLDRLRGYRLGAVDYVSVPVVPEILRSKVAVLVELHCKRRELQDVNRNLAHANAELASLNTALQRVNAELESANLALKEQDRLKDEFLAVLAHELRSPLAPIYSATVVLHREPAQDPQINRLRGIVRRQLAHMTRLVDDLLDVSRITRGQINLTTELVDIPTLVARAVETVQPLIDERGHTLTVDLPAGPLTVAGDLIRLTQALANVLGNAAKYTTVGGRIGIFGHVRGGRIDICVRDTGIGIPPDQLERMFELFTQLKGPEQTGTGLGIGLALARRLVEMHRGHITAWSEGPGKGTLLTMSLPLAAGEIALPAPREAPDGTSTPRRILVAEDNNDTRVSLALLLEKAGHRVHTAVDGRQALESAEHHRPDVILLDIGMPLLDGYEVARRIRAQPWGEGITLIAVTGRGQESDRRLSREAGLDSHLVKPVDLDALAEALDRGRTPAAPLLKTR